jgi:hypothetical protein
VLNMLCAFGVSGNSLDFGGKTIKRAKIFVEIKYFNKSSFYTDVVSYRSANRAIASTKLQKGKSYVIT